MDFKTYYIFTETKLLKMRIGNVKSADTNLSHLKKDRQLPFLWIKLMVHIFIWRGISPITDLGRQGFKRFKISSGEGKTVFIGVTLNYLLNGFTWLFLKEKQKTIPLLASLIILTAPDNTVHFVHPQ